MKHLISILCLSGFLASCSEKEAPIDVKPRPVITHLVTPPQLDISKRVSGVTQAEGSAELSFEIGGRIIDLPAVSGARYKKGQVLARVDTAAYQDQLRQVQAEATRVTDELKRVQQLFESGNTSKAQLDNAIAAQKSSSASVAVAKRNVSNGDLTMPYDGIIGEVLKDAQEVVSSGTPVLRIQGDGPMEMLVGVPADYIGAITPGVKATINLPSISNLPHSATVKKVSPQASENTTYPVTLVITEANAKLRDGLDGEATFILPNPQGAVIRVPLAAIVAGANNKQHVWIISQKADSNTGVIEKRTVTLGSLRDGSTVEILSGLTIGERIMARGVHRIEAGAEVSVN